MRSLTDFENALVLPRDKLSGFAFRTEKFAGCEHSQTIDRLADQTAEIPAIKRKQDIGASEGGNEHRLVLGNVEIEGPVKSKFVAFDDEPAP